MGRFGIFVRQGGDTVKSVKQKMRVQLRLEHMQTGLCEMGLQLGGASLSFPKSIVKIERIPGADDRAIGEHVLVKMVCNDKFKQTRPGEPRVEDLRFYQGSSCQHAAVKQGSYGGAQQVCQHRSPWPGREVEPPANAEDRPCEKGPSIPFHRFPP